MYVRVENRLTSLQFIISEGRLLKSLAEVS